MPTTRSATTRSSRRSTAGRAPRALSPDVEAERPQHETRRAQHTSRRKARRSQAVRNARARTATAPAAEAAIDAAEIAQMEDISDEQLEKESRREHFEEQEKDPKYFLIVGGRAMATRSLTAVPLEMMEDNTPFCLGVFHDTWAMSDGEFADLLKDTKACERHLRSATWELMQQATVEITAGMDATVDYWRTHADTAEEVREKAIGAGFDFDVDVEGVQQWYFGDEVWNDLDVAVRPGLFVAQAGKLVPVFNGRTFVRHMRRIAEEAMAEFNPSPSLTFCLRPANTAAAAPPNRSDPPRHGSHGGTRPNAGRPEKEKTVCIILHTGTKQTQTSGGQVKFYRTDVGDPLMVVKSLTELPETDVEDPEASVAAVVDFAYELLVDARRSVPTRTGAGAPPQAFKAAGASSRQGENAKELLPVKLLADIAPRQMGRGMAASYTHELVLTFPHGDQVASGPAPPGYKAQVFDFTPIVINPGATASSKAQRTADKQNSKSDVMQALRVVALGYRRSNRGDPASGTPPFAKIVDGGQDGQKRLEFWWDCLQNGTLAPEQNPVGWDFKSGELPRCPPWKDGLGIGVKAPEGGLGPASPRTGSNQNPNVGGGVADQVALMRSIVQQQQTMSHLLMHSQLPSVSRPPEVPVVPPVASGQRTIAQYFNTPPRAAVATQGGGTHTDIAAALQNPAVIAAVAAALGRSQ